MTYNSLNKHFPFVAFSANLQLADSLSCGIVAQGLERKKLLASSQILCFVEQSLGALNRRSSWRGILRSNNAVIIPEKR